MFLVKAVVFILWLLSTIVMIGGFSLGAWRLYRDGYMTDWASFVIGAAAVAIPFFLFTTAYLTGGFG